MLLVLGLDLVRSLAGRLSLRCLAAGASVAAFAVAATPENIGKGQATYSLKGLNHPQPK